MLIHFVSTLVTTRKRGHSGQERAFIDEVLLISGFCFPFIRILIHQLHQAYELYTTESRRCNRLGDVIVRILKGRMIFNIRMRLL